MRLWLFVLYVFVVFAKSQDFSQAIQETCADFSRSVNSVRLIKGGNSIVLDVNDSFIIVWRFSPSDSLQRIDVAVMDGARAIYGSCKLNKHPKVGDRRETWLTFEFPESDGVNRGLFISRTFDFLGRMKKYGPIDPSVLGSTLLEGGINVSFNGGFLEYTQLGGLIGPRQRRALSARIDTRLPNGKLSGSVTIDSDAWDFSIDKITSISSVNGKAVSSTNKPEIVVDPYKVDVTNYNAIEKNGDIRSNSTSSYIYYGNVICFHSDCDPSSGDSSTQCNQQVPCPCRYGLCGF
jgi:hypothetical protein